MRLEGLNRHAGMHAAGVVIAERPLWEYVPLFKPAGEDQIVTQFNMNDVEKAGLVKFDFLGLKTLTVIATCIDLMNKERTERGEEDFDIAAVPLVDVEVYKMLSSADVTGVFQVESSGFRELLKKLKPDCFEDIVAAGALYRPGPLEGGMVDDFIDRKHGRMKVEYDHPLLEPILRDTYGVIVYQEQVMQISSALAGYSLGRADLLRRAMGKKKAEVMAKEKEGFLQGATVKAVDPAIAERVFDSDGEVRRLRLQPQPLGGLRPAHLSDRLPEAALLGGVHSRPADLRPGGHRRHRQVHRRGAQPGHPRPAPRRQRIGRQLHGGEPDAVRTR